MTCTGQLEMDCSSCSVAQALYRTGSRGGWFNFIEDFIGRSRDKKIIRCVTACPKDKPVYDIFDNECIEDLDEKTKKMSTTNNTVPKPD